MKRFSVLCLPWQPINYSTTPYCSAEACRGDAKCGPGYLCVGAKKDNPGLCKLSAAGANE